VYAASVAIGLCLGVIGAGGSILTIPVLVYLLKTDPLVSTIYSMFIVGACSFVGTVLSAVKNCIDFKAAVWFGIPSVIGVFAARKLIFPLLPEKFFCIGSLTVSKDVFIMVVLAGVMLFVSLRMLKNNSAQVRHDKALHLPTSFFVLQGVITGIVTGLLGVGGGFLIVPALLLWARLSIKIAIGTALLIITINSAMGFASGYSSIATDWALLLKYATGAIVGILAGTRLADKLPADNLKKILAWFIIITSVYVLYRQIEACAKSSL